VDKFIILIWNDVEPTLRGPYVSERGRIRAARRHRTVDPEGKDSLFRLNVGRSHRGKKVEVECFSRRETEGS